MPYEPDWSSIGLTCCQHTYSYDFIAILLIVGQTEVNRRVQVKHAEVRYDKLESVR